MSPRAAGGSYQSDPGATAAMAREVVLGFVLAACANARQLDDGCTRVEVNAVLGRDGFEHCEITLLRGEVALGGFGL